MASPPDEPDAVEFVVDAGIRMYRVHRTANSPAFFDVGTSGRFNPPPGTTAGYGTLYLALEPSGAFLETLGRTRFLTDTMIAERRLTTVAFGRPLRLFALDATANRFHRGFDLADEAIATSVDYRRPQQLGAVVHDEGLDGLVYPTRHDNSTEMRSVAVYGPPGSHSPGDVFAHCDTTPLPTSLVDEMIRRYRFEILPELPLP
jgi:hypothetical protein